MTELTNKKQFDNVVLIIKNGSAQGWASTSYILSRGELGICYLENGKVIVKAGNGQSTWSNLPQVEGVFEEDLTLTYAFGKYSPDSTGSFILQTAGKTMSEVMLDAYAQEIYEGLILTTPTASFSASGAKTSEVGESYSNPTATLTLTPTGTYKYQSKDSEGNKEEADISFVTANIRDGSSTATPVKTIADVSDNTITYTKEVANKIVGDTAITYTFYADAAHGEDNNRPLTNLGNFVTKDATGNYCGTKVFADAIGQIGATTVLSAKKAEVKITGYRKMFMGTTANANPTINSAFVRSLDKVSEKAQKTTKTFTAKAGQIAFYVAIPTSLTTATPTFNYKFFGEWKALSGVVAIDGTVDVEGANGYTAKPYKIYKYVPESGSFDADTEIQVIVK